MSQNAFVSLVMFYTCVVKHPAYRKLKGETWSQRLGLPLLHTTVSKHHPEVPAKINPIPKYKHPCDKRKALRQKTTKRYG